MKETMTQTGSNTSLTVRDYWLLIVINHTDREFMLRVEDTAGTGRHDLGYWYRKGRTRAKPLPVDGPMGWLALREEWIIKRYPSGVLEQYTLAKTQAEDPRQAKAQLKACRQNIARALRNQGYDYIR